MSASGTDAEVVVRTVGLTKTYGRTIALREVDLTINAGEVFGYLGPNGAGKTTTIRLLMGMLRPTAGHAEVLGHDAWTGGLEVRGRIGYLAGEPALYERLTGRQHVEYFSWLRRRDPAGDRDRAAAMAKRLDLDLSRPARTLSKGNKQKLSIVLALMSAPELLILDEPTTGLDPFVQQEFHAMVREHTAGGGSVLLSSHVLAEVQRVATRIGVVRAGRLIAVERLDTLRGRSLHHVTAQLADQVGAEEFAGLPDLRDIEISDHSFSCSAPQSALDGLVKQLSRHPIVDFSCTEAELEETFLAYYADR
ncbi:MAG TPA: ABC transporter ATP-binding protein [Kineosporiaceae bacterium]|nr:ABC transporter ATP-binding protein [Kineosporiaceae bacterium]